MKLSKRIPARTQTIRFRWLKQDFMEMSPKYRESRSRCRNPMDTCFWCSHKFEDGEMMALAQPEKGRNKILCQSCAQQARQE